MSGGKGLNKGDWYPLGERGNPLLKPKKIDGRMFFSREVKTSKGEAEDIANKYRDRNNYARVIPMSLWSRLRGYPDSIPSKRDYYVVFHSLVSKSERERVKAQFTVGTKVKLREDVLVRDSRSVLAHIGYTTAQFQWRDTLGKLKGKVGTISRTFSDSKHVNVDFDNGVVIGIDYTELVIV